MSGLLNMYQHLPEHISPDAFNIGSFPVNWYPLMYIAAFLTVYFLLRWRIKKGESGYSLNQIETFMLYSFFGVIIGGRLGYVFFYNFSYYSQNIFEIFLPFKISCSMLHAACFEYSGFYGMSYHGGLIGVLLATWHFTRKNKSDFLAWADFAVPAIPAGFFFGRIGNFLNGELFGRVTTQPWGMYFPSGGAVLRHPSQIYEAIFEGLIIFVILWFFRNNDCHPELAEGSNLRKSRFLDSAKALLGMTRKGGLFISYIFLYGFFRFFIEFFREPDPQIGLIFGTLSLGQILSALMVISAVFLGLYSRRKKVYNDA